jgi:hypothetical protein
VFIEQDLLRLVNAPQNVKGMKLPNALSSVEERQQFRLIGGGEGIHWELLDEDISLEGFVADRRSTEFAESLRRWLEDRGGTLRSTRR